MPTWDELQEAVPFRIVEPVLQNGWVARPRLIAGDSVLIDVFDEDSKRRCNIQVQPAEPLELGGREPIDVGGFTAWWRRDFEDVPGARSVTNVVAEGPGFSMCAAGYEEPAVLASILTVVAMS
jgi:hypothetical protein